MSIKKICVNIRLVYVSNNFKWSKKYIDKVRVITRKYRNITSKHLNSKCTFFVLFLNKTESYWYRLIVFGVDFNNKLMKCGIIISNKLNC